MNPPDDAGQNGSAADNSSREGKWIKYKNILFERVGFLGKALHVWLREIIVGGIPLFSLWFVNFLTNQNEPYWREVFIWSVVVSGGTLLSTKIPPNKQAGIIFIMRGLSTLILLAGALGYALLAAKVVKANITIAWALLLVALGASLAIAIVEAATLDSGNK